MAKNPVFLFSRVCFIGMMARHGGGEIGRDDNKKKIMYVRYVALLSLNCSVFGLHSLYRTWICEIPINEQTNWFVSDLFFFSLLFSLWFFHFHFRIRFDCPSCNLYFPTFNSIAMDNGLLYSMQTSYVGRWTSNRNVERPHEQRTTKIHQHRAKSQEEKRQKKKKKKNTPKQQTWSTWNIHLVDFVYGVCRMPYTVWSS